MNKKVAVVLLNLGGPNSLHEVEEFLFNLFRDKYIIGLPGPFRVLVAWLISKLRAKSTRKIYELMGGGSTILPETERQADALEKSLNDSVDNNGLTYKTFVCMRHSRPTSSEVLSAFQNYQPEQVVLLPMYPQYSSTTTLSALEDWFNSVRKAGYKFRTDVVCCYYEHKDYIAAHCNAILSEYNKALLVHKKPRILFSAHSLPVSIIEQGDPYQQHVQQTVDLIIKNLNITNLDYSICYQSKIGPVRWLEPSTKSEILKACEEGIPLVVVPITFVSEHSETLVELDLTYKSLVAEPEKHYFRVPTLSTERCFIKCLRDLVRKPCATNYNCKQHRLCWKNFVC